METKVLEIIKDESEKADVRKYTCINGFGYSQFERNIAERVVKLFAIPDVSNRRELLIAFASELQKIGFNEMDSVEKVVDIYLKSN